MCLATISVSTYPPRRRLTAKRFRAAHPQAVLFSNRALVNEPAALMWIAFAIKRAAIDANVLSGDPPCFVAGDKCYDAHDVVDGAEAAKHEHSLQAFYEGRIFSGAIRLRLGRSIDDRTWSAARYRAIYHAVLELEYGIREDDAGMREIGSAALRFIRTALENDVS